MTEAPKKIEVKKEINHLAEVDADTVKFLNESEFCTNKPFSEDILEVEVDIKTGIILRSPSSKFFEKVVTELIAKNTTIQSLVVENHQPKIKSFFDGAATAPVSTPTLICVSSEKKGIWVFELDFQRDVNKLILKFTDKTYLIAKQLGKSGGVEIIKEPTYQDMNEENKAIDIIFFRLNSKEKVKKWVTKTAALLNKANLWPNDGRPKFIAIQYEDNIKEKILYNHPFIDDLIFLPFDRLIFLQKIEIALALPKKVSPNFLFVQEADDEIEIAKSSQAEFICDIGLAIKNPIPLAQGTPAHFYIRLPGQKNSIDIYAKAFKSVSHPEEEGKFLVYFYFFGIGKEVNREIKSFLARDTAYKNLINQSVEDFKFNPDNIFITDEQKVRKTIAVIDHDATVSKNITEYLKEEIDNIDIAVEDSYFRFFKKYLEQKPIAEKVPAATQEDFYADEVSIIISFDDLRLQMPLTPATEDDRFLGHEIKKIYEDAQGWLVLFDGDARNLLHECLQLVKSIKRVSRTFEVKHFDGNSRSMSIEFILESNDRTVRLNFKLPEIKSPLKTQLDHIKSLDCIIVDYNLLPEDLTAFINGLKEGLARANIKTPANGPKVIVTVNETQKIAFDKIFNSQIYGLVYKPIEVRRLLFLATEAINTPFSIYTFENIGWKSDHFSAKMARLARLTRLAEFGATIKSEHPLKPGTMLYLFKSIYNNAPDKNLCVRIYASQEDDSQKGTFLNSLVYFGITDAFLKFTRAYIRETYASKKNEENV